MVIKIEKNNFTNEQNEIIDYCEIYLCDEDGDKDITIRVKPFDDENRKLLNRVLRQNGYKIGKRKENNT